MAEMILHEPLGDEAHASEIVREGVLTQTDASNSPCSVHEADDSYAWKAAQCGVLRGSATSLTLSGG
jgi:hypothetical protein